MRRLRVLQVPANVLNGFTLPVVLTIGGVRSNVVTIATDNLGANESPNDDPVVLRHDECRSSFQ